MKKEVIFVILLLVLSIPIVNAQESNDSDGFFQSIVDFFRNIFGGDTEDDDIPVQSTNNQIIPKTSENNDGIECPDDQEFVCENVNEDGLVHEKCSCTKITLDLPGLTGGLSNYYVRFGLPIRGDTAIFGDSDSKKTDEYESKVSDSRSRLVDIVSREDFFSNTFLQDNEIELNKDNFPLFKKSNVDNLNLEIEYKDDDFIEGVLAHFFGTITLDGDSIGDEWSVDVVRIDDNWRYEIPKINLLPNTNTTVVDLYNAGIKDNKDIFLPISPKEKRDNLPIIHIEFEAVPQGDTSVKPESDSDLIDINGKQVLLDGVVIAEQHGDFVGPNVMVDKALGDSGAGSTLSVPNDFSSTGGAVQDDFFGVTDFYYLKEVQRSSSSDPFSNKEIEDVDWAAPLLPDQNWDAVKVDDVTAKVPKGEDIHVIVKGDLTLPATFILYNTVTDKKETSTEISDPEVDCKTPNEICSANLDTSNLDEGYYYGILEWDDSGDNHITEPLNIEIGNGESSSSSATVTFESAGDDSGDKKVVNWRPRVRLPSLVYGEAEDSDITVYEFLDSNPNGISIGDKKEKVEYKVKDKDLTFTVDTDWKSYTSLNFDNGDEINLRVEGGSISIDGDISNDEPVISSEYKLKLYAIASKKIREIVENMKSQDIILKDKDELRQAIRNNKPLVIVNGFKQIPELGESCGNIFPLQNKEASFQYDSNGFDQLISSNKVDCPLNELKTTELVQEPIVIFVND